MGVLRAATVRRSSSRLTASAAATGAYVHEARPGTTRTLQDPRLYAIGGTMVLDAAGCGWPGRHVSDQALACDRLRRDPLHVARQADAFEGGDQPR